MKTFLSLPLVLTLALTFFGSLQSEAVSRDEFDLSDSHSESEIDLEAALDSSIYSDGDVFETYPDGSLPEPPADSEPVPLGVAGPITPATGQPQGALTGRIVYTSGGHGWQRSSDRSFWTLDRPLLLEMNESYGNRDQMSIFAEYAFNAGATVVAFRPIGFQSNEVVIDNVDSEVIWNGTWNNSSQTVYYGKPGQIPYRWASLAVRETATATYVPNIPEAGFYPVYTWVMHGSDRTFQLYRIRHTGGESEVRIPHHMVGNGWVYLGTYYFNKGSDADNGAVVISNLRDSSNIGSVAIADAIRFGNGMSTDGSTYPKEGEASRYWIKNSLGVGQSTAIYDVPGLTEGSDNVGAPIRMAREMNREANSKLYDSIYLGFHSNATTGNPDTANARGTIGLYNTASNRQTPNQLRWAYLVAKEINDQMVAMNPYLEVPWHNRGSSTGSLTYGSTYGEINNLSINSEFDATIIEVAFHDNVQDAKLLRDPKVRNWIARASLRAVVKYMNEFANVPLNFLPEPPTNARAVAGPNNTVRISWDPPKKSAGSGDPAGYIVYRSSDGYGFGQPIRVNNPGTTSVNLGGFSSDDPVYFRVSAFNAGGESFPSETVGATPSSTADEKRVLYVNAFKRFDRTINIRQTPTDRNYRPPGHNGNSGSIDRIIPRSVNSFDYVVQHGRALHAAGRHFDSCSSKAVGENKIPLDDYDIVIWAAGSSSVEDESFTAAERARVAAFLDSGGSLFASGSEIGWHLDRQSGPTQAERDFLHNYLNAGFGLDDAGTNQTSAGPAGIFAGLPNLVFDNGPGGIYPVRAPDRILPRGKGSIVSLLYSGGSGGPAAVQNDGSDGGGRTVYLGFPFETILDENLRASYMERILDFLEPTGFARWQKEHFSQSEIADSEISDPSANPSGDGIPNLLKYALHLDPHSSSRDKLPQTTIEDGFLTFEYRKSKLADDLDFEVEISENLTDWRPAADEIEETDNTDKGEYFLIKIREKDSLNGDSRRFFRLRIAEG